MDLDAAHAGAVFGFWEVQTEEGMAMVTEYLGRRIPV